MSRSAAVSLVPPPSRLADLATIAASFMQSYAPGLPRYLQLQNAIIRLIQSGALRTGAQLPPDQQLTRPLDVSLGTVQKAFGGLAADGWISREHGRGTFIAQPRQPVTDPWHYRFRDPQSEAILPVYTRLLKRRRVNANEGPVRILSNDLQGFVKIERLIDIAGRFSCYSELYLPADRFTRILEMPTAAIESVNLKKLFADEFGAPTISVEQSIRASALKPEIANLMGMPKRASGMILEATAFTYERAPFSFQRIHIPPSECSLDVSPIMNSPRASRQ